MACSCIQASYFLELYREPRFENNIHVQRLTGLRTQINASVTRFQCVAFIAAYLDARPQLLEISSLVRHREPPHVLATCVGMLRAAAFFGDEYAENPPPMDWSWRWECGCVNWIPKTTPSKFRSAYAHDAFYVRAFIVSICLKFQSYDNCFLSKYILVNILNIVYEKQNNISLFWRQDVFTMLCAVKHKRIPRFHQRKRMQTLM